MRKFDYPSFISAVDDAIKEGVNSLFRLGWQNEDGGFGRTPLDISDPWSTAEALILASRVEGIDSQSLDKAINYLINVQREDGGWGSPSQSDTTGTALSLLALVLYFDKRVEVDVKPYVQRGIEWLSKNQNPDGGWPLLPDPSKKKISTMFTTIHAYEAVAAWFLRDVGENAEMNEMLTLAHEYIIGVKMKDCTWGLSANSDSTIRHTSYVVLTDRSPLIKGSPYDSLLLTCSKKVMKWLVSQQHKDGMWGESVDGDIESTSAAIRALLKLKVSPLSESIRSGVLALLKKRRTEVFGGREYKGWGTGEKGGVVIWPTFYALMALKDFRESLSENLTSTMLNISPGRWKMVIGVGLLFLVLLIIVALVISGTWSLSKMGKFVLAALTIMATIAEIIGVYPVVKALLRK